MRRVLSLRTVRDMCRAAGPRCLSRPFSWLWVALVLPFSATVAQVPQYRLTQELRIDGAAEEFEYFRTIAIARDGRLFVPSAEEGLLKIFDASGRKAGSFGRKGQGPGEFEYLSGPMGWHGDTLWIVDFNQRRITFVGPDLRVVRMTSTIEAGATAIAQSDSMRRIVMTNVSPERVYRDGSLLVRYGFGPRDPVSFSATDYRLVIVDAAGNVQRVVARLHPTAGRVFERVGNAVHSADVPFASKSLSAINHDGSAVALASAAAVNGTRGSYALTLLRSNGDTVFSRVYAYDGVRIPQARLDSAITAMTGSSRARGGVNPGEALAAKARPLLPVMYPPVSDLQLGDDGTVWLGVYDPGRGARYRVLDALGNTIAELTVPARSVIARATRTQLWLIEYDADLVPSVVRYRLSAMQ